MTEYRIPRNGDVDLVFDGQLLAENDSWRHGSDRWTEIRIYATTTDKWVTEMVGRSRIPKEVDRRHVAVHDTPDTIRDALSRDGDQGRYLTRLAIETLTEAGQNDPALEGLEVERI